MKKVIGNIGLKIMFFILAAGLMAPAVFAQNNNRNAEAKNVKIFVEYKIIKDKKLNNSNINVSVSNKSIVLTGNVPTLFERNLAGKDAAKESHGYSIKNDLKVAETNQPSKEVVKNVMNRIYKNGFYGIFDWVDATDTNGILTLSGWVHNPWLKDWYQKDAEKVAGVRQIKNDIQNTFGPGSIGYRAAWLIYSQPEYEGSQFMVNPPIHIIVNGDSIILKGRVYTKGEGGWLQNLLEFRTGAFNVSNNLEVKS